MMIKLFSCKILECFCIKFHLLHQIRKLFNKILDGTKYKEIYIFDVAESKSQTF